MFISLAFDWLRRMCRLPLLFQRARRTRSLSALQFNLQHMPPKSAPVEIEIEIESESDDQPKRPKRASTVDSPVARLPNQTKAKPDPKRKNVSKHLHGASDGFDEQRDATGNDVRITAVVIFLRIFDALCRCAACLPARPHRHTGALCHRIRFLHRPMLILLRAISRTSCIALSATRSSTPRTTHPCFPQDGTMPCAPSADWLH